MIEHPFGSAITVGDDRVEVRDASAIASPAMDKLAFSAVFGSDEERDDARWLIWEIAQSLGVRPSSIHDLYLARGKGKTTSAAAGKPFAMTPHAETTRW